jgi:hypothetical protein
LLIIIQFFFLLLFLFVVVSFVVVLLVARIFLDNLIIIFDCDPLYDGSLDLRY